MRGHYPPISILDSLSRLMSSVATEQHLTKARALRLALATYSRSEDLIRIGAYQKGADPVLDSAVQNMPALNAFLQQPVDHVSSYSDVVQRLEVLPG
jgi:flagellum-specific ATP synthase